MVKQIAANLTRCHHGRALAVLHSEPFNGMEARPAELLALAQVLVRIAHAAVEHNSAPHLPGDERITLEVENG